MFLQHTTTEFAEIKQNEEVEMQQINLDYNKSKKAALILRAVNHKLRQQILEIINNNDKITVTEIYVKLRIEQSVASQHLAILRRAGVVSTVRDGKFIYYSVASQRVDQINNLVEEFLK